MFHCSDCTQQFNNPKTLIDHLKYAHGYTKSSICTCRQENCFRMLSSMKSFINHLNICHSNEDNENVVALQSNPENSNISTGMRVNKETCVQICRAVNSERILSSQKLLSESLNEIPEDDSGDNYSNNYNSENSRENSSTQNDFGIIDKLVGVNSKSADFEIDTARFLTSLHSIPSLPRSVVNNVFKEVNKFVNIQMFSSLENKLISDL